MRLGERTAEHGEVLRENVDQPPVDLPEAGNNAVPEVALLVQSEVRGAVGDERIEFHERPLVHEQIDAFAGGELALGVLLGDAILAATQAGLVPKRAQACEAIFLCHSARQFRG